MKTFKQFNEEAKQHLDEVMGYNNNPLAPSVLAGKVIGGVANVAKKVTVGGVRRAIDTARGIKKFIKNRPNTVKFEIQQDSRESN